MHGQADRVRNRPFAVSFIFTENKHCVKATPLLCCALIVYPVGCWLMRSGRSVSVAASANGGGGCYGRPVPFSAYRSP